jgi:hypothetical protein
VRFTDWLVRPATLRLIYVRAAAIVFLVVGLLQWGELLGAIHTGEPIFLDLTVQSQAVVLFFAVANLVAAVGLWIKATWGLVIWFAASAAHIVRHTVFANALGWTPVENAAEVIGMILFILLIIFQARVERREVKKQRETRRNRAGD